MRRTVPEGSVRRIEALWIGLRRPGFGLSRRRPIWHAERPGGRMPVIVVTRLRLKDPALADEFFADAVAAIEQAQKSAGNLATDALADADNAWWTVTAWQERRRRPAYLRPPPHP